MTEMNIRQLGDEIYYVPNASNIGIIGDGGKAVFVDTGIDDDVARKAARCIEEKGLPPSMIVNTHSHADHCGGNKWLQRNYAVFTIAPEVEAGLIEYTELEPIYFFSGAAPIKDLKHKMFQAKPSAIDEVFDETREKLLHRAARFVPLYGHSPRQMGVGVDGVLFCADSVFSDAVLDKHKVPFYVNIGAAKQSLHWLRTSGFDKYVPSHGEPFTNIDCVVELNLRAIENVERYIKDSIHMKMGTSEIVRSVSDHFGIEIQRVSQYYLMNTAVMAYLSYLSDNGYLFPSVNHNMLYWQRQ